MIFSRKLTTSVIRGIQNKFGLRGFAVTTLKKQDEVAAKDLSLISPQVQVPVRPPLPLFTSRELKYPPKFKPPMQAWISDLNTFEEEELGFMVLHPDIFAAYPRIDIIHHNTEWQRLYRKISWATTKSRAEVRGGGRKPWPQKGTGRARHGSIRSPIWKGGGRAHGPRGPKTYFYMLPFHERVLGLVSTLSAKFAQDDIAIVESLEIPTDEPKFLESLAEHRSWGLSVLFVDDTDIIPRNIALATDKIPQFNVMPVYGLNVHSMLKHHTLVLTMAAVEKIEDRLLYHMNRTDSYHANQPFKMSNIPYSPLVYEHLLPK